MLSAGWDLSPVFAAAVIAAVVLFAAALAREHRSYRAEQTDKALAKTYVPREGAR